MPSPKPAARAYRIGIDVGGTFTKAVLIDHANKAVVGRYSVMTTHAHERGVAAGVVEVFRNVLEQSGVHADEVVFLAHSTTQATNALLEGDVAKVGVIGIAGEAAAKLAREQVRIDPIDLGPGRLLHTANRFLVAEEVGDRTIKEAIDALRGEGAEVLVASAAFGVDNTASEEWVRELGREAGLLATCGHEITRLYGLTTRTRTAVINASILPKMNATAEMTEESVRMAGIKAPVMIMRGDGGVMDIAEMRRRPAMTMLSGPAASVAGALMHLKISDGIYFEVGGTSTNIGVIQNGRPTISYAQVGGHETYVTSLDVRVVGIAGGSLIRAEPGRLIDVGPRSAHIAGLRYAAFAADGAIRSPEVETFEPRPGDGCDYIAIRSADGSRYAVTTTCAANVLGLARPGMHAAGNPNAARTAFEPLARMLGVDVETAARMVLDCATDKVIPVVEALIATYKLDSDQTLLVGEGGGAGALVPHVAQRTGYAHEISKDAEVISSIGVALALVRETIERVIPHPQPEDLQAIRKEAIAAAVRLGADARAVDVTVEVDTQTHRVRATAIGAAEMNVRDESGAISEAEARSIAAQSMHVSGDALVLAAETPGYRVYSEDGRPSRVRAVDWEGTLKVQRRRAFAKATTAGGCAAAIRELWRVAELAADPGVRGGPRLILLHGRHMVDLSGVETLEQAEALASSETGQLAGDDTVALIAAPAR
ncbi:MAG: hydantoinase/oxoprolinase family protein [Alphaproteobacteria bacterium]|nr:hydantoinase/oxoprolinase family protein [Alphaproteobacteria bacterium]